MTEPTRSIKRYYAARAPYYDDVYEKPERADDIAFLKTSLPAVFRGRTVLEVACGTGYWTQHIAPVAASMVATDGVAEPLAIAKTRPGAERVRFQVADAYALPVALGHFDAAFAGLWLSHVPRKQRGQFLDSLHRLLLPGAKVVLIDNSRVQCKDLPITGRDEDGNTYQDRALKDGSKHRVLKIFPSQAELENMIAGYGWRPFYRELSNFWWFEYEVQTPSTD